MSSPYTPLAERVRPQNLDQYIGQTHLVGLQGAITKSIQAGFLPSMILWGPAGTGKTSLAYLIAKTLQRPFEKLSAISDGIKEVRNVISKADRLGKVILFIDEIHRFNKSQQDALLGAVESGQITLIGATTENPSFEVNAALLSRCQVYRLKNLSEQQLWQIIENALAKDTFLKSQNVTILEKKALLSLSCGDARTMLNLLELAVFQAFDGEKAQIDDQIIATVAADKSILYDKNGEQHYDVISAFIKSIRGSDPNAATYWLARMLAAGEDVKFIARRMLISASEDIGLANPTALPLAVACADAVQFVGMPEARIILSQTCIYLATSPKSNASYLAINTALQTVKETGALEVPLHLRNAATSLLRKEGYGKGYKYAHDYPENFVFQEFMPEKLSKTVFYRPGENTRENALKEQLRARWKSKYNY